MTAIIKTKYLAPTNTKGSRVKATHTNSYKSLIVGWECSMNSDENHVRAFEQLLLSLDQCDMAIARETAWVHARSEEGFVFIPVNEMTDLTVEI